MSSTRWKGANLNSGMKPVLPTAIIYIHSKQENFFKYWDLTKAFQAKKT